MEMTFDFSKTKDAFEFHMEKKKLGGLKILARAGYGIDVSPSMDPLFTDGTMERLNQRVLPIALRFDDNAEMDVACFDTNVFSLPGMREDNYQDYVKTHLMSGNRSAFGGTAYAPIIDYFTKYWFEGENISHNNSKKGFFSSLKSAFVGKPKAERSNNDDGVDTSLPGILVIQTDGENQDEDEAKIAIENARKYNLFIIFVGVGASSFRFIKRMARDHQNVSFVNFHDMNNVGDDAFYDALITNDVAEWLRSRAS